MKFLVNAAPMVSLDKENNPILAIPCSNGIMNLEFRSIDQFRRFVQLLILDAEGNNIWVNAANDNQSKVKL